MSYYILPKINNEIRLIQPALPSEIQPCISQSLIFYLEDTQKQLINILSSETEEKTYSLEQLHKIVNPYEFIFTKLPNSKLSVSKLKPFSNRFYDLLEIFHSLNLLEPLSDKEIHTIHLGSQYPSSIECVNMLREFNNDMHFGFAEAINDNIPFQSNDVHFMYFENNTESNLKSTVIWLLKTIQCLLRYQKKDGVSIIKTGDIFYKPMIDVLYILCNFYDKVYLIKPNTSNILNSDKYIVCKKRGENDTEEITKNIQNLIKFIEQHGLPTNLVDNDIPCFFVNKLEEFNIITGQQQLTAFDNLIAILKLKNKEDRIETIKKINIQKCISWCEKYKIPNNKFNDKNNIFLPLIKIEKEEIIIESEIL